METKYPPSFTVSLRGYDREEVDEYLDSLAEALGRADQAEERCRRLQAYVGRITARVHELEERIRTEAPKSGAALGERIALVLRDAEKVASEHIASAESEAERILAEAAQKLSEAQAAVADAASKAEAEARRIEAAARSQAAATISEAEARAGARTRQMEEWAEQVIAHTRAEQARIGAANLRVRNELREELRALEAERERTLQVISDLREALGRAAGVAKNGQPSGPDPQSEPEVGSEPSEPQASTEPHGSEPQASTESASAAEADSRADPPRSNEGGPAMQEPYADTGEAPHGDQQFEDKLEAWINAGPKEGLAWR
jgi:DivIVA domain-containing protein